MEVEAHFLAKEDGIVAGIALAEMVFNEVEPSLKVLIYLRVLISARFLPLLESNYSRAIHKDKRKRRKLYSDPNKRKHLFAICISFTLFWLAKVLNS